MSENYMLTSLFHDLRNVVFGRVQRLVLVGGWPIQCNE